MRTASVALVAILVPLIFVSFLGSGIGDSRAHHVGIQTGTRTKSRFEPALWAFQSANQQNTGYSPETKIGRGDVSSLAPAWTSVPISNLAGTPVVSSGLVYLAGPPYIYAVNESTGAIVWQDGPGSGGAPLYFRTASGVTLDQDTVFAATTNNFLAAINASTGALDWSVSITNSIVGDTAPYSGAQATPLVWNGIVVVGETQGDNGPTRGVIQGFSEANGSHLWTFYTVPPVPVNSTNQGAYGNSWGTNGTSGCYCGGGAVWNLPALDPNTGIIYFGTGNAFPASDPFVRQASAADNNLYTQSVVALNIRTGALVWSYQETNPGYYDYDQGMPVQLFYTRIGHLTTEVVTAGGKDGYYYELNAKTGALINKVALGIHSNDDVPASNMTAKPMIVYPGVWGGINSFSTYDPLSNTIYATAYNFAMSCSLSSGDIGCNPYGGAPINSTLYAIDASSFSVDWSVNLSSLGGGVSSANNLIFYTDGNQEFYAADAFTGQVLWHFNDPTGNPGASTWGPPSVVDGYVFWETSGSGSTPGHLIAFSVQGSP